MTRFPDDLTFIERAAERIDRLMSLDVAARGVIDQLYGWARNHSDSPLCLSAARLIAERVGEGDIVFIATGWPDRPHISPQIAETDGPPGAAALARALLIGLKAVPVVLIEPNLVSGMTRVLEATGLRALSPEEASEAVASSAPIMAGSVLPFPVEREAARQRAHELIDTYAPKAAVAVEKGGMNEHGYVHTSRGDETTKHMAKVDYLFQEAARRNIATVGIGDGGNEIGMSLIADDIRAHLPYGKAGKDPKKGGIAPSTITDVLVAASISNWGAYGVAACLALLLGRPEVLHDAETEARLHRVGADASFIDGITGMVEPGADGLRTQIHEAFITVMGETVRQCLVRRK
jgi:D-glutamate cyclase